MTCPNCGSEAKQPVHNSRKINGEVRRYRRCSECHKPYQTIEKVLLKNG